MIGDALFLAREDLRHYFRHAQVWIWVFVMPLLLTWLIGSLMAVAFRPGSDRLALYASPDAGFLADEIARRLKYSGYEIARVPSAEALQRFPLHLEIPQNFTQEVLAGRRSEVRLTCRNSSLFAEYDRFRVNRAVLAMLADTAVLSRGALTPTPADFAALEAQPRTITLHEVSAGEAKKIVLGFQQSAPGFIVMFTLLVSFTAGGALLAAERRLGILKRLACSPISRAAVVAGKFGSRFVLGLIQMSFAMLAARWIFGVDWGGSRWWAVIVLLMVYTALCAALSLLLGSLVRNESQSIGLGVIAANILAALGGCWWPIELTPPAMQQFALVMPTGWAMHGLHRLLNYGSPPVTVLPHLIALGLAAVLAGWLAVRRFEFR